MTLSDLSGLYGGLAQTKALIKELAGKRGGNVFLQGLRASSAPLLFSALAQKGGKPCLLVILNDQVTIEAKKDEKKDEKDDKGNFIRRERSMGSVSRSFSYFYTY